MPAGPKVISLSDPATKLLFSSNVNTYALWGSLFLNETWGFVGDAKSGKPIVVQDEFQEHGGKVTLTLLGQLTGDGTVDGAPVEGTGGHFDHWTHSFEIHELTAQPFEAKSQMEDQYVEWDVAEAGRVANIEWWNTPLNSAFACQSTGYTCTAEHGYYKPAGRAIRAGSGGGLGDQYTGMNAVTAIEASRVYRPASAANDESLTGASHVFSLDIVDYMAAVLPQTDPPMRPAKWAGGESYLWFIHTDQLYDLERDPRYQAIEDSILQGGGDFAKSSWATGNVRPYKGFIFIPTNWAPPGVHSSTGAPVNNVRRSWIWGATAIGLGFGVGHGQNRFRSTMGRFNRGGSFYYVTRSIWGADRIIFNSKSYGCFVVPTRAVNRGDSL